jgi:5'-nucleotidase
VFTQGRPPFGYLRPLQAHLFLSANARTCARRWPPASGRARADRVGAGRRNYPNEVRIAFDGDAVLFSDEAEQVFQADGLDAFQQHELSKALLPLPDGPFKPLLQALHRLQQAGNDRRCASAPRWSRRAARRRTSAPSAR